MQAKFTHGSIWRHICIMTLSGTVGLLSLFLVDLVDLYFLSLLEKVEITAALGYAGSILFFTLSIGIGLSIGCGAITAQVAGSGDKPQLQRRISHIFLAICLCICPITAVLLLGLAPFLELLGASGGARREASAYLWIILPSTPLLAVAMASNGVMRALGHAKNAMYLTLIGAAVNALLDPLFIFALDWGMQGAAAATVFARVAMLSFGLFLVSHRYGLLRPPQGSHFANDCREYARIALPAVLTNLSTPIGFAFITATIAPFGDSAVSGNAIISRLQQVAFAGLFALSGAIGGIAAQNLGARQYDRVAQTLAYSVLFVLAYCAVACSLLFFTQAWLVDTFKADGQTATLLRWFCSGFSLIFVFHGITFVTNALFNNLRVAHYATQFNFGKATLGTMPFVYLGAEIAGPFGIYLGALLGAALVAALGLWVAHRHIKHLPSREEKLQLA